MSFRSTFAHIITYLFHHDQTSDGERARLLQLHQHCQDCPRVVQPDESNDLGHLSVVKHYREKLKLIGFVKPTGPLCNSIYQREKLQEFCDSSGYELLQIFEYDKDRSAVALHDALEAMQHADGLIITDMLRLVDHHTDPMRDLAPLVHDYFFHDGKQIISIKEGIDTSTFGGQEAAITFLNDLRGVEFLAC